MFWKRRKREKALELSSGNYKDEIKKHENILVFFEAPWCGACKILHPLLNELADENRESLATKIAVVNTDQERELSQEFSIRSLPTLLVYRNEKLVHRGPGMISKPRLQEMIDNLETSA